MYGFRFAFVLLITLLAAKAVQAAEENSFQPTELFEEQTGDNVRLPVALGDINDDGLVDLIYKLDPDCRICPNTVQLFLALNRGDEYTFTQPLDPRDDPFGFANNEVEFGDVLINPAEIDLWRTRLVDIDSDGDLDLIAAANRPFRRKNALPNDPRLAVYFNNGVGPDYFSGETRFAEGLEFTEFDLADLDGDGDLDVLASERDNGTYWLSNLGNSTQFGPFSPPNVIDASADGIASAADLDGDNDIDVVVNYSDDSNSQIYLNGGSAMSFTPRSIGSAKILSNVQFSDLNADGAVDIVAINAAPGERESANTHFFLNSGTAQLFDNVQGRPVTTPAEPPCRAVVIADINSDSHPDLVKSCDQTLLLNTGNSVPFDVNAGSVEFSETGTTRGIRLAADVDNDGDVDLVGGSSLALYLNNGFTNVPMPLLSPSFVERTVSEDVGSIELTLSLNAPQQQPVSAEFRTLGISAEEGLDFTGVEVDLVFAPGETAKTVRIPILNDDLAEFDQRFLVRLSFSQGVNLSERLVQITITDDNANETGQLRFRRADQISEADGNMGFLVSLDRPVSRPVSFGIATQPIAQRTPAAGQGTDYYGKYEVLTIAPGQTDAEFNVTILADESVEPDEYLSVRMFNPVNAVIDSDEAIATGFIKDSTPRPLSIRALNTSDVDENSSGLFLRVEYDNLSDSRVLGQSVTIVTEPIDAKPGLDYVRFNQVVEFGDFVPYEDVFIQVIDDDVIEGEERFTVRLLSPSPGLILDPQRATTTITIMDDD